MDFLRDGRDESSLRLGVKFYLQFKLKRWDRT